MVTKKELEEKLNQSREIANGHYTLILKYREEVRELENKVSKLESDMKHIEGINNRIEILMGAIISILAGDSHLQSKAEAITDLLLVQVFHKKEDIKHAKENRGYSMRGAGVPYA